MRKVLFLTAFLAAPWAFATAEFRCGTTLVAFVLDRPTSQFLNVVRYWGENSWGDFRYARAKRLERLYGHAKPLATGAAPLPEGEGLVVLPMANHELVAHEAPTYGNVAYHDATIGREHGPAALAALVGYNAERSTSLLTALAAQAMLPVAGHRFTQWASSTRVGAGHGGSLPLLARFWTSVRQERNRLEPRPAPLGSLSFSDGRNVDVFFHDGNFFFYVWRDEAT